MKSPNHIFILLTLLTVTSSSWASETSPETTFTISGSVGVAGVTMRGLPGAPTTDENGRYTATVLRGWSCTVVPTKMGYAFHPPQRTYRNLQQSFDIEDYEPSIRNITISGNVGLEGVVMQGLPGHVASDPSGCYTAQIPYGWAGTVAPLKHGYAFEPARRRYLKVTTDQKESNYTVRSLAVSSPPSFAPSSAEVLVIPTSETNPKVLVEVREDMQVMVQILREMLSEPRMILGMLYDYGDIFGGSDRCTQAFYLEGYGALFVTEVDFPFSFAPEDRPQDEPAPGQEVDPVWLRARQKLRSPGAGRAYGQATGDEMSFEQFKADLIKMLKHATNIRHVDPNENVIVTIIGQDQGSGWSDFKGTRGAFGAFGGGSSSFSGGSFGPGGGSTYANSYTYSSGSAAPGSRAPAKNVYGNVKRDALGNVVYQNQPAPTPTTVLTIRAKKADVDAFAAGQIDLEQFQQRVNVLTY